MSKTLLFFGILFFCSITMPVTAQSVFQKSRQKMVIYNKNVNSPLDAIEKRKLLDVYGESLQKNIIDIPQRLKSIKNILRNRVQVIKLSNNQKDYKLLSQVPLFNKYNLTLTREKFDITTFNPLKYTFDFYNYNTQVFRIDNTDYYIIIKPQHLN